VRAPHKTRPIHNAGRAPGKMIARLISLIAEPDSPPPRSLAYAARRADEVMLHGPPTHASVASYVASHVDLVEREIVYSIG
jgi:hypothetical protein